MCDTLCLLRPGGTVFAKNSDRPVGERQLLRSYPTRRAGGELRTQYLTIEDAGAAPVVLSQPTWLWGAEHGVNSYGVAIGNEKVYGRADPYEAAPALIGMDLVRLGLERGRSAGEAVDAMTGLLEMHGQGGIGDETTGEPYWSSFVVADPSAAWVLETCGRSWAAEPVDSGAAISNRLTIRDGWAHSSGDVAPGADFDDWRNPDAPTGHADVRLACSRAFLRLAARDPDMATARGAAAHLRDHGDGPWGFPGRPGPVSEVPAAASPDGTEVTICMHVRRFQATTSSLVAELSAPGAGGPSRAWATIGNPCVSVFVPFAVSAAWGDGGAPVPAALGDAGTADRFAALRRTVEKSPGALEVVRGFFSGLEALLWEEVEGLGDDVREWEEFCESASRRLLDSLDLIEAKDLGPHEPAVG